MPDIIRLLPDTIANQIAAGEVVQRPASAIKELMENAIDAKATDIKVVLKDAGRTLIQVIDNGAGMSPMDARMCWERHATSKIQNADDLFKLSTKGFRGEALASIAAVAQVEMRTRRAEDEVGTLIEIEGSEVKRQEPVQTPVGTSMMVKNLFFNVPVRRNFLKANAVEMRHILDDFQRVALAHPEVSFSLHHNGIQLVQTPRSNLRQRLVSILGQNLNKIILPIEEETEHIHITGFIGKPEGARKTRGEQFFFVNDRFIKSSYLHHAVSSAYESLLQPDTHPFYCIFMKLPPERIDVNVHPTKTEIKFEDERLIYNYLQVTVRHALGQYSLSGTLDFEAEPVITNTLRGIGPDEQGGTWSPDFTAPSTEENFAKFASDFEKKPSGSDFGRAQRERQPSEIETQQRNNLKNWETLYSGMARNVRSDDSQQNSDSEEFEIFPQKKDSDELPVLTTAPLLEGGPDNTVTGGGKKPLQIHNRYILTHIKSGFLLIDQQLAHERVLFERFLKTMERQTPLTQQLLFPMSIRLSALDAELLRSMIADVNALGIDVRDFGADSFVVHGLPPEMGQANEEKVLEALLEEFKVHSELRSNPRLGLARALARNAATKRGQELSVEEMQTLTDQLFACETPFRAPNGTKTFITLTLEELEKKFS